MNDSSRSRKMCISGFITAPMREHARYISENCHQLGSWHETTSLRPTPSRARPTAMRSAIVASSRQVKRVVVPCSTDTAVSAGASGAAATAASR